VYIVPVFVSYSVVQASDDAALANDIRAEMDEIQRKIAKAKGTTAT
jgi:hypothetical protein